MKKYAKRNSKYYFFILIIWVNISLFILLSFIIFLLESTVEFKTVYISFIIFIFVWLLSPLTFSIASLNVLYLVSPIWAT